MYSSSMDGRHTNHDLSENQGSGHLSVKYKLGGNHLKIQVILLKRIFFPQPLEFLTPRTLFPFFLAQVLLNWLTCI